MPQGQEWSLNAPVPKHHSNSTVFDVHARTHKQDTNPTANLQPNRPELALRKAVFDRLVIPREHRNSGQLCTSKQLRSRTCAPCLRVCKRMRLSVTSSCTGNIASFGTFSRLRQSYTPHWRLEAPQSTHCQASVAKGRGARQRSFVGVTHASVVATAGASQLPLMLQTFLSPATLALTLISAVAISAWATVRRKANVSEITSEPTEFNKGVLSRCPTINSPYRPFPFLTNGHVETIFASKTRGSPPVTYERASFACPDGGTVHLDYHDLPRNIVGIAHSCQGRLEHTCSSQQALLSPQVCKLRICQLPSSAAASEYPCCSLHQLSLLLSIDTDVSQDLPDDAPVLILLPGLTGGSHDSYVRHMVGAASMNGMRAVVFNSRGTSDGAVTSPQFYSASYTGDMRSASCVVTHCSLQVAVLAHPCGSWLLTHISSGVRG